MTRNPQSHVLTDPPDGAREHVHLMVVRRTRGATTPLAPATLIDPRLVVLPESAAPSVQNPQELAVLVPGRERPVPVAQVMESNPDFGHVLGLELAEPVRLPLETPPVDEPLEEWLAGCDGVGPYDGPGTPAVRASSRMSFTAAAPQGGLGRLACRMFHKRGCRRCR